MMHLRIYEHEKDGSHWYCFVSEQTNSRTAIRAHLNRFMDFPLDEERLSIPLNISYMNSYKRIVDIPMPSGQGLNDFIDTFPDVYPEYCI